MPKRFLFFLLLLFACRTEKAVAQTLITLYNVVPNSKPSSTYKETHKINRYGSLSISKVTNPTMEIFFPQKKNNQHVAIILCPGGGYSNLAYNWEGPDISKILVKWGITVLVLKYRLPSDSIMIDKSIGPLQDLQRAIQLTRIHAKEWEIDNSKIGVMGFSAGGHLAAMAATRFTDPVISNPDSISLRPDFSVLLYPVISFDSSIVNWGSRRALIGNHPSKALVRKFSAELQVTRHTPPAFIAVAADDKTVNPENSLRYFQSMQKHKDTAELHIYQNGGHGFSIKYHDEKDEWLQNLKYWLVFNHFLQASMQ